MNRTFQFRCTAELFSKEKPGAMIFDLQGTENYIPNECEYAVEWEDRLAAWMEKKHVAKPAPLLVERREKTSFGF